MQVGAVGELRQGSLVLRGLGGAVYMSSAPHMGPCCKLRTPKFPTCPPIHPPTHLPARPPAHPPPTHLLQPRLEHRLCRVDPLRNAGAPLVGDAPAASHHLQGGRTGA